MKNPGTLKIKTLSGEWCDKDTVMLHACFQLLTDCVKDEKLLKGHTDWTHSKEMRKAKAEIEALCKWWKDRMKSERKKSFDPLGDKQYEKDNEMLIRLIKVRRYLWT